MTFFKSLIKSIFRLAGLEIGFTRSNVINNTELKRENKWLMDNQFHTIIDIGANEGQFAQKARKLFPNSKIISFEPIPSVYQKLKENFQEDKNFCAFNVGLGKKKECVKLTLNEYTPSSSILKMEHHTEHFNFAVEQNEIEVQIDLLDNYQNEFDVTKPYLVKIDVQGYEDRVIEGGKSVLENAQMIITEVSFTSLYHGQVPFGHIYSVLLDLGFKYVGNYEQLHSPVNNEILQADAIFVKSKHSSR